MAAIQIGKCKLLIVTVLSSLMLFPLSSVARSEACGVDTHWRVSFGHIPGLTEPGKKSFMVDFVGGLADDAGVKLTYEIAPFKRSIINVGAGRADLHLPMLQADDKLIIDENLMYSEAAFFDVSFYVYMNAERKFPVSDITSGAWLIETEATHAHFFPFPVSESDCLECSLQKLVIGRIDAYLYAEDTTERTIRKLGLEPRIHRELYKAYPVKAVLPRNECGEAFNQKLNQLVPSGRRKAIHPAFRIESKPSELSN